MTQLRTDVEPPMETIAPFRTLTEEALADLRHLYAAIASTRTALTVLFAIDAAQMEPDDGWIGFFVETACAQLIWDERPTGTLTAADATWVLARFDEAPTLALLALLVRLVEEAHATPSDFAGQVRRRAALFNSAAAGYKADRAKSVPYLRLVA